MIPKHVHEEGLEKAMEAYDAHFPNASEITHQGLMGGIATYLSHIAENAGVIEGMGKGLMAFCSAAEAAEGDHIEMAKAALSYLRPDNAREGE